METRSCCSRRKVPSSSTLTDTYHTRSASSSSQAPGNVALLPSSTRIGFFTSQQDDEFEMSAPNPASALYLDDLSVGQRFSSTSLMVTAETIKAFAREFDPQPFHLDEAAAERTFFGRLAASGWHTAALTMRLNVEGGLPIAAGIIGAGGEITWPTALRANDTI